MKSYGVQFVTLVTTAGDNVHLPEGDLGYMQGYMTKSETKLCCMQETPGFVTGSMMNISTGNALFPRYMHIESTF